MWRIIIAIVNIIIITNIENCKYFWNCGFCEIVPVSIRNFWSAKYILEAYIRNYFFNFRGGENQKIVEVNII